MKKSLLLSLACALGLSSASNAQTYVTNAPIVNVAPSLNVAMPYVRNQIKGDEVNSGQQKSIPGPSYNPYTNQPPVQFGVETIIGQTTYDLQSNSSVQNRIMNNGDGTISAIWTYSNSYDIAAADRGTGYNYFNGVIWGAQPGARIESEKTGWPNIGSTASGKELFIGHNIDLSVLTQGSRSTIGSGVWTLSNVTATDQVWNRMAVGGANGETVHQISLFDPFGGPWTNGVQSQLLYFRSTDGGVSNDIAEVTITGLDETNYTGFSGDSYSIAAKGDTVVAVYFGALSPTTMAKSTDNGATWTSTVLINVFPAGITYDAGSNSTTGSIIGISDINGDEIADTLASSDGSGWVLLDHDGMAHVFFGFMDYTDVTPGDDSWSYFPSANGLMYWNENFGDRDPITIAGAIDVDGNGVLDILADFPSYNVGMSSFPSAGISDDGCIYVSYSAMVENNDQGAQNYRHIYIVKSCDNGCSWSDVVDVTPGNFQENVYCSMARDVDANINILWQRDAEPGSAVIDEGEPGADAYVLNDIVHSSIPVTDINTSEVVCTGWVSGDTLFCTGDSVLLTASCGAAWAWSDGSTTQEIWYSGAFGDVTVDITTLCGGVISDVITVSAISVPPIISVAATQTVMCNGDQSMLSVASNTAGTVLWSTGETTDTISVDSVGTYIVTVNTCGGAETDTIVISLPIGNPVFSLSATKTSICEGDTSIITASAVSEGTILWSTGDTTFSISVDSTGTYSATVTNCGGDSTVSITVTLPSPPTATITGAVEFCSGDSSVLNANIILGENATYLWSTGATTDSIYVSTAATFELILTTCGGVDTAEFTTNYPSAPTSQVSVVGLATFCEDLGDVDVDLQAFGYGFGPFSYLWSNGDTAQSFSLETVAHSGFYTFIVTDACGGMAYDTAGAILIHPSPTASEVEVTDASEIGVSDGAIDANVTGGTAPYAYLWDDASGQTNEDATSLEGDMSYELVATDANGCEATLDVFVGDPSTGITEVNIGSFSIHPNPTTGRFVVDLNGLNNEEYSFVIRNIIGQTVYAETFNGHTVSSVELDLSTHNKGVYFLTIGNSKNKRTEKLIVH